jgi:hypothetical protein
MGLLTGLIVIAIGACLPIWIVWHIGEVCGVGRGGFLWQAAMQIPSNARYCDQSDLLSLHRQNLLTAGAIYLMAWVAGFVVYWIARRRGR